jgi:uncharacterized membrane protein
MGAAYDAHMKQATAQSGTWLRRGLAVLLAAGMVSAGVSHFVVPQLFIAMVPPMLPSPPALVYLSGVAEVGLGLAVLLPAWRRLACLGLIALYIAVFPANVHMALAGLPFGDLPTPSWVLWARLPLQAVFIAWAYYVGGPRPAHPRNLSR